MEDEPPQTLYSLRTALGEPLVSESVGLVVLASIAMLFHGAHGISKGFGIETLPSSGLTELVQ